MKRFSVASGASLAAFALSLLLLPATAPAAAGTGLASARALNGHSKSAATTAADPIVGMWTASSGQRVDVEPGGSGFVGTVVVPAPSGSSPCASHPSGFQVWNMVARGGGVYVGTYTGSQWVIGGACKGDWAVNATWTIAASGGALSVTGSGVLYDGTTQSISLTFTRATPDFSTDVSPASATTAAGGSVVYTLTATASGGFSSTLTLSVDGRPAGTSFSYPAWTGSVAITVSTSQTTPPGTYTLTIDATGGGVTHSAPVTLVVTASPSQPPPTTTTPTPTPTPKPPVPADHQVPISTVSNGCGGGTWKPFVKLQNFFGNTGYFDDLPGTQVYKVNFVDACNLHDAGYSGAMVADILAPRVKVDGKLTLRVIDFRTWSQFAVDTLFLNNLLNLCRQQIPAGQTKPLAECAAQAEAMYLLVHKFGSHFWRKP